MITPSNLTPQPPGSALRKASSAASINIETARLSLTRLKPTDVVALTAIFGTHDTARQARTVIHPFTREAALALIERSEVAPNGLPILGIRNEEGHLIGVISLTKGIGQTPVTAKLGPQLNVFIAPDYQAMGYAPEAIEGLVNWVRKNRLHKMLQASHFADNLPSAETLISTGFLYTGRKTHETSLAREGEHLMLHMIRLI